MALIVAGAFVGPALARAGRADEPRPDASPSPSPGAEQLQFAAHEHDLGYRAYVGKQFDEAATHFENAFFAAPNPVELRNAIRARRDGRQLARAATLAAIGQRKFGDDAATAKLAQDTIAEARPAVFEVQIESEEGFSVAIDDKVVVAEKFKSVKVFTSPGHHDLLVSWSDDRSKRAVVDAKGGATQSLFFDAPAVPVLPPPTATAVQPPAPPPPPTSTVVVPAPPPPPPASSQAASNPLKPFTPPVVVALAALTAVGAGVATWSGLDAENNPGPATVRRECVGMNESCQAYQKGLSAQLRTNVLLAVTGVVGLSAGVIGVFLTDWSGHGLAEQTPGTARVGRQLRLEPFVGPASAGLLGTF